MALNARCVYMLKMFPAFWFIMFFLFCTNDYNPFGDYKNARTVITSQSFGDSDTLEIFSTESIKIAITAPNLVDSVKIKAIANRKFINGQMLIPFDSLVSSRPFNIYFSFFETGLQIVEILTYRNNGDSIRMILHCYLKSPLKPKLVKGNLGEEILLATVGVKDYVRYEWDFGSNVIESYNCTLLTEVRNAVNAGKGLLCVYDGSVRSPYVEFDYEFDDLRAPIISLLPITYIFSNDTVKTSQKTFYFSVNIRDLEGERIDSASINGTGFDIIQNDIYTKVFFGLDTIAMPLLLKIYASDNYIYQNITTKEYLLVYDQMVQDKNGVQIAIITPSEDRSVVLTDKKDVFIKLNMYTDKISNVKVLIECNNKVDTASESDNIWVGTAFLKHGENIVTVRAVDSINYTLDSASKIVIYDTAVIDSVNPVILEIRADDEIVKGREHSAINSMVNLTIVAFDEASGIRELLIDDKIPDSSSREFLWTSYLALNHQMQGQTFNIKVTDNKNNVTQRNIKLFYNHKPFLIKKPDSPRMMVLGETYSDTIKATDIDGDFLQYKMAGTSMMTISNDGVIKYCPDSTEIGRRNFTFIIDDGFGKDPFYFSFDILVMEKSQVPDPVRFLSTEDSLPLILYLGKSTTCTLSLDSSSGTPPFFLKAFNLKNNKEYNVNSQTMSITLNHTDTSDTGKIQCLIIVTDSLLTSDTLYPVWRVVSSMSKPLDLIESPGFQENGIIDLTESAIFKFQINDTLLNERNYSLSVKQAGVRFFYPVDYTKDTFSIVLNPPDSQITFDTIVVTVANLSSEASCTLSVFYGNKLNQISLLLPKDSTNLNDSNIVFSWQSCTDTSVSYELSYGIYPILDKKVVLDTGEFSQVITKSGIYGWKVTAFNKYSKIESKIRIINIQNPSHIRLNKDSIKTKTVYKVGKDTINVALTVLQRTIADTAYHCWFASNRSEYLPTENSRIKYLPQENDTGWQQLVITVEDESGNSDTISKMIYIYSQLDHLCKLLPSNGRKVSDKFINYNGIFIIDTLLFMVGDDVDFIDINVIKTNNQTFKNDDNLIRVIVDTRDPDVYCDTIIFEVMKYGQYEKISYFLYYGVPPVIENGMQPEHNDFVKNELDSLKWNFTDADGDSLLFDLFFGESEVPPLYKTGTKESVCVFDQKIKPGIYYWQVVAKDCRYTVKSPVYKIYVNSYIVDINNTQDETLIDFPLLVRLNGGINLPQEPLLSFRKATEISQQLPYEIESWNDSAVIWLHMDTIKPSGNEQLVYMIIGRDDNQLPDGRLVFDTVSGFEGVWHLQQDDKLGGPQGRFKDATYNAYHGDDSTGGEKDIFIGKGHFFKRDNQDQIVLPQNSKIGTDINHVTVDAWVKFQSFTDDGVIVALSNDTEPNKSKFELYIRDSLVCLMTIDDGNMPIDLLSNKAIGDNSWHYIVGTVNFKSKELSIYIDGVLDTSITIDEVGNNGCDRTPYATIGSDFDGYRFFDGSIDEIRISKLSKGQDWIKFCYENQKINSVNPVVKVIRPNE